MPRRKRPSRLSRRQKKRYVRQSLLFTILTVFLIFALLFWGIPSLVKLAIFLSDLRSSTQSISGKDSLPPSPPILQPVVDATNSAIIRMEGFAEEGSTVILSINSKDAYETIVESDGEFLFNSVQLRGGENRIVSRAIDVSGNESQSSSEIIILYDETPPSLTVDTPTEGASFFGASEQNLLVSGSTDPGSRVLVNGSFVILSQDGKFSNSISLSEGENPIIVTARDRAGNTSSETRTVTYSP